MNLEDSKLVVAQYFNKAEDPSLTDLLESYQVNGFYRPYLVAGLMIYADYRQLVRADVASWDYDKLNSVKALLGMQQLQDNISGETIPDGLTIDDILNELFPGDNLLAMRLI